MSIQMPGDSTGFRRHSYPQNAEINVTPFVDVMLVLLVIFMIAAPIATVTVPVDLPRDTAASTPPPTEPVAITLAADGTAYVGTTRTTLNGLLAAVDAAAHGDHATRLLLRGDQAIPYGRMVAVMNRLADGGYDKVGLVTQPGASP